MQGCSLAFPCRLMLILLFSIIQIMPRHPFYVAGVNLRVVLEIFCHSIGFGVGSSAVLKEHPCNVFVSIFGNYMEWCSVILKGFHSISCTFWEEQLNGGFTFMPYSQNSPFFIVRVKVCKSKVRG